MAITSGRALAVLGDAQAVVDRPRCLRSATACGAAMFLRRRPASGPTLSGLLRGGSATNEAHSLESFQSQLARDEPRRSVPS